MATIAAHDAEAVRLATSALDAGELVVIPTETGYALVADALVEESVARAFLATNRAADRPLGAAVAGIEDLHHVAYMTPLARDLAARHWPGPLSLVLRARPWLPDPLTAGGDAIAVRAPAHPFAQALARHFGPLAITAARQPGQPRPATVAAARDALRAEASLYVDAGDLGVAAPTVVDAREGEAKVLRAGGLAAADLHGRGRP